MKFFLRNDKVEFCISTLLPVDATAQTSSIYKVGVQSSLFSNYNHKLNVETLYLKFTYTAGIVRVDCTNMYIQVMLKSSHFEKEICQVLVGGYELQSFIRLSTQ